MFKIIGNKIVVTKGDDATFIVKAEDECGNAQTLDGTLKFTVRATPSSTQKFQIEADSEGRFSITHTDSNIDAGLYVYDVQYTSSADNISTIASGWFEVQEEVTQ